MLTRLLPTEWWNTVPLPLKSLANISVPDSSTITVQPYDRNTLNLIERRFPVDVGFNPNNDGTMIRLNIPH